MKTIFRIFELLLCELLTLFKTLGRLLFENILLLMPGDKTALCSGEWQYARKLEAGQLSWTRCGAENL
jgi:hypothetical protein